MPTLDDIYEEKEAPAKAPAGVMDVAAGLAPAGMAEKVGKFAKPSIAPTIGSLALPAALTAVAGPMNAPFIPLEQGIGSAAGEMLNQNLGITELSPSSTAAAFALPTALGYGANAMRALKTVVPPSAGAETLNALAPKEAAAKMAGYANAKQSGDLFKQATQQGVQIAVPKTVQAIDDLTAQLGNPSAGIQKARQSVAKYMGGLRERLMTQSGKLTPAQLQAELQGLGELERQAAVKGGPTAGIYKKLFSDLSNDLDNSAEAAAGTLKDARQLFKREKVLESIDEAITNAFKLNRGQGEAGQFNANKIVNTLQDENGTLGKFFHQAFSGAERKDLTDFFTFLNTIPALSPGAGQQYGSGRALSRIVGSSIVGGGAGAAIGTPAVGGPVGAAIGALTPPAMESVKMLRQVWSMPGGRQMLKGLLANSDGALTPQVLATLGAFLSGQVSSSGISTGGTLRPFQMEQ